ncbi:MAG: hypothetical protein DRN05_07425 [Thermoplasmata archaeon]|nr:MAG: hypothetical protein DRN05_07425 [Thermoplasmata archaeon]
MKKIIAIQITIFVLTSGTLMGLFLYHNIYDEVQLKIVSVLCLSCIKLNPKTHIQFIFQTANHKAHPDFVLENLTKGPLFIYYTQDACHGCEIMDPIIKDVFNINFDKKSFFYKTVFLYNSNITFIHINLDHSPSEMTNSLFIYDKDHVGGVPMFVVVTLGYDFDVVKPYYTSAYGTLDLDTYEERKEALADMILDGIELYKQNQAGFRIEER